MKRFQHLLVALPMIALSAPAAAVMVGPQDGEVCESVDDDRHMTVNPTSGGSATCLASGSTPPAVHKVLSDDPYNLSEVEEIKDPEDNEGDFLSISGLEERQGTFSIDPAFYALYDNVHISFKVGANLEPDWFAYSLDNVTEAEWAVNSESGQGDDLSHARLWGDEVAPVPAPGILSLLGAGLLGLGFVSRCRKKSAS